MGKAGMLVPPPCTPLRRLEMPDPPPPPRVLAKVGQHYVLHSEHSGISVRIVIFEDIG